GRALAVEDLASLARVGSGSACRSLLGGFVEWLPGAGGSRIAALAPKEHWPLAVLVAVTSDRPKRTGSREGMERTRTSSPYYEPWLAAGSAELVPVREAILRRDLGALGAAIERNCLRMHAAALGADPPLLYWEPATVAVIREVWRLREAGVGAFFSIDAGPQVKVLCEPPAAEIVEKALASVAGVLRVMRSGPGSGARRLDAPPAWAAGRIGEDLP
ncbi:MAG: diphosphomevalonate/mevalonate 3,5-bisphosphate decarboxylase family protein, partial [Candidatus Binatia bacterium]